MKKLFILITVFIISIHQSYSIPTRIIPEANNRFEFSLGYTSMFGGLIQENNISCVSMDFAIGGLYFDYSGYPRSYERSVQVGVWDDGYGNTWHFGYLIPIEKTPIKLSPLIGYAKHSRGVTNGWDWGVDSNGIINDYTESRREGKIDYGACIRFSIPIWREYLLGDYLYITGTARITRFSAGVSIGMAIKM